MIKRSYIVYLLCFLLAWSCREESDTQAAEADTYYTCSMHPQIMESKPGKCPICHMPLIEVRTEKALNPGEIKLSDEQIYLGNIRTDTLRNHSLSEQLVLSGTVAANAELTSKISARAMGRIEKLYVRAVGDFVRKGQVLYALNSDDLNLAIKEYLLAQEKKNALGNTSIDIESLIESARNKLEVLGLTNDQIKYFSTNGWRGNVVDILSPAEGIVTEVIASEGAYLMEGSPVLSLAQYDKLWVLAQVYPQDLRSVMAASAAIASIAGVPNSIKGRLTFVSPEYGSGAKISEVRMEINNDRNYLKPGMRANVNVTISSKTTAAVPVDAVIHGQEGATVWVRLDKNTFVIRMVQTGMESDGFIEIVHGLKQGEIVVTSGAYLINSEYLFRQGANPMEGHDMSKM